MKHIDIHELTFYLDGEVTRSRALQIEAHLESCGACHNSVANMSTLFTSLKEDDPALAEIDLVDSVMAAIAQEPAQETAEVIRPPISLWSRRTVGLVAALAACFIAVILQPGSQTEENIDSQFRVRGSETTAVIEKKPANTLTGLSVYRVSPGAKPSYLAKTMHQDDSLLFAYANAGKHRYKHMMVVGIDRTGNSHWYYPAWTDPNTDPLSIPIEGGRTGIELKEAIRHAIPSGPFTLYGIFTDEPLHVSTFEKLLSDSLKADTWTPGLRFNIPQEGASMQVIETEVK